MITSARWFGWLIALIGGLMAAMAGSYLLFGVPLFNVNGVPVETPAQALEPFAAGIAAFAVGAALVKLLQPKFLGRFPTLEPYVRWLEALPTDDPLEHKRLYAGVACLGIPMIALASGSAVGHRMLLLLLLPVLGLIGWGMVWLVLGFQLINPFAHLLPWFLTFAARFFHFFFLLGAGLTILYLPASHTQQAELGMSAPFGAGAAVAASRFLRLWSSWQGNSGRQTNL